MLESGKHVTNIYDPGFAYHKSGKSVRRYDIQHPGIGASSTTIVAFAADWEEYIPVPEYVDYKEALDAAVQGKILRCPPETHMIYFATFHGKRSLRYMGSLTAVIVTDYMLDGKKWIILHDEVSNE